MNETKLLTKYQGYLASMPDVEVVSAEEMEKGLTTGRQRYEVEFIVVKAVPSSERKHTKQAWEAIMQTAGQIAPEAVANGLNKGIHEVPVLRYRLNDEQRFTELCQNLIFDSRQSDRVLAAYYVVNREDSVKLLENAFGSISLVEDLKRLPTTSGAADQFVRHLPIQSQPQALEVRETVEEGDNGEKLVKFTAIFMEDEEEKEILENGQPENIISAGKPQVAAPVGNLDDAIAAFVDSSKNK